MDFGKFTFRQIDAATRIKSFDCGDADLNDFLISDAVNYYKSMMALTYLLEDNEADKTVAYYSLLNDKIVFDPDEKKLWNRLNRRVANSKRRKEYPAVKIGRLAISKDYAGKQIGRAILLQVKHIFATMRCSAVSSRLTHTQPPCHSMRNADLCSSPRKTNILLQERCISTL